MTSGVSKMVNLVLVFGGQGPSRLDTHALPGLPDSLAEWDILRPYASAAEVDLASEPPEIVQALLVVFQVVAAQQLTDKRSHLVGVVGQSLGELSAAVVAACLSLGDALAVAEVRARAPRRALGGYRWCMVAVNGLLLEEVLETLEPYRGRLEVAAINSPDDVVVSGLREAFESWLTITRLPRGRVRALPVVAPYHTSMMAPILDVMRPMLASLDVSDPQCPVVSATTGGNLETAADVERALLEMLVSPVRWSQALTLAARRWPRARFCDCGPSGALVRFVRKNGLDVEWVRL